MDALKIAIDMAQKNSRICPRCGRNAMDLPINKNALSRHADLYICGACGMDEALRDMTSTTISFDDWYVSCLISDRKEKNELRCQLDEHRRALHIAAIIMQRDGLCRYEDVESCRHVSPTEEVCIKCIEKWLRNKARKELRKE